MEFKKIGTIHNDFDTKFGLPRQSGILKDFFSVISFEPSYRDEAAFRGIDGFSHLWILWLFSQSDKEHVSLTVRPPKLGGNTRMGVFATRSPYRPNPIGLSCVKIEKLVFDAKEGPLLYIGGGDFVNGTPVLDIKPYLPAADSVPTALSGFTTNIGDYRLEVCFPDELLAKVPPEKQSPLIGALEEDPRPGYQHDPSRVYTFTYGGLEISFTVEESILIVKSVEPII